MRRILIAVMGPGEGAGQKEMDDAALVGEMVAKAGWAVLTGGRVAGVMGAAAKGARTAGGLTIGVLPTPDTLGASPAIDVVLATGLGEARNAVIALSANACVVCGMNAGTASEVALAIRAKKPVILLRADEATSKFFRSLDGEVVRVAMSAGEAIELLRGLLMAGARPL
ncbi:MAG TPA: hypothetical protein VFZ21_15340 [Gemmatimonadaceae bacterium]|jgi:uncharacterized protein (TIGR00725 family)|nr:hypothetical protein [Gemmatimonadaceae bacterium]